MTLASRFALRVEVKPDRPEVPGDIAVSAGYGVVHGWVYFVYLLCTANLAVKVRWPIAKTIGVLLAGTIPLLGILVEQVQTREIKERFNL